MRTTRWNERTFPFVVRECAQNEHVIAECNRVDGTKFVAPIVELLDPAKLPDPKSQTALDVVCFIGFVHQTVWQHLLRFRRMRCQRVAARSRSAP